MKWTDVNDIAIELYEAYPEVDPLTIRFTDLHNWVIGLAAAKRCLRRFRRFGLKSWIEESD